MKQKEQQPQPKRGRGRPRQDKPPKIALHAYVSPELLPALDKAVQGERTTRSAYLGKLLVERLRADGWMV